MTATNAISVAALDLINSALRLLGVQAAGETLPISDANDCLVTLQQMIDAWNADRLAIFTTTSNDFPFVLGTQSYTLGPGGNFDIERPARIDGMSAILLTNPSNPVEVPIYMCSVDYWQVEIPVKVVNSSFPQVCYDDGNFPLRTLNFWPIPQYEQNSVRIYSWQPLTSPGALNAAITFPQAYSEALRFNLAVRLAPEYGAQLSPVIQAIAVSSLAAIKTMNAPDLALRSDLIASPAGYNYKADLFGIPY
jgi:hypothetical protein